ncbi:hypothetical protein C8Q70DRAFT_314122 [Cubamyces menziesii]|nr:hypothetical protein C8Q70DRAFT_314122 [Cubamyces menziesii]
MSDPAPARVWACLFWSTSSLRWLCEPSGNLLLKSVAPGLGNSGLDAHFIVSSRLAQWMELRLSCLLDHFARVAPGPSGNGIVNAYQEDISVTWVVCSLCRGFPDAAPALVVTRMKRRMLAGARRMSPPVFVALGGSAEEVYCLDWSGKLPGCARDCPVLTSGSHWLSSGKAGGFTGLKLVRGRMMRAQVWHALAHSSASNVPARRGSQ